MDTSFFKGLLAGFLIALPVGPVALVCIQRTLSEGKLHGMVSGLGAATADAFYGFIAAFGLTFISSFLAKENMWLRLFGGLFICYMGARIFLSRFTPQAKNDDSVNYVGDYASAFLLTLTNPLTFLAFAAIFAGLRVVKITGHYLAAVLLVAGVFIGSGLWWLILTSLAGAFLRKLGYDKLVWLNKISGVIIAGFGLFVLLT